MWFGCSVVWFGCSVVWFGCCVVWFGCCVVWFRWDVVGAASGVMCLAVSCGVCCAGRQAAKPLLSLDNTRQQCRDAGCHTFT